MGGDRYILELNSDRMISIFTSSKIFSELLRMGRYQEDAARGQFSYNLIEIRTSDHPHLFCYVVI